MPLISWRLPEAENCTLMEAETAVCNISQNITDGGAG